MPDWLIFLAFLGMAPFWLPWVIVLLGVAVVSIERNGQFKHCQIGGGWRFRLWKIAPEAKDSVGLNRQPRGQP